MEKQFSEDTGPWVVEWCSMGDQKGLLNIETISSVCSKNMDVFFGKYEARYISPWITMGVFKTIMDAGDFADKLNAIQDERPAGWREDDTRIFIPVTENEDEVQRLKTMPYPTYLQTSHWQTIKEYARAYAQHRCQVCNGADCSTCIIVRMRTGAKNTFPMCSFSAVLVTRFFINLGS